MTRIQTDHQEMERLKRGLHIIRALIGQNELSSEEKLINIKRVVRTALRLEDEIVISNHRLNSAPAPGSEDGAA